MSQQHGNSTGKQPARRTVQIAAGSGDPSGSTSEKRQQPTVISAAASSSFQAIVQAKVIASSSKHKPNLKLDDRGE